MNKESKNPWYTYPNLIDIVKCAGYRNVWISNQVQLLDWEIWITY